MAESVLVVMAKDTEESVFPDENEKHAVEFKTKYLTRQ